MAKPTVVIAIGGNSLIKDTSKCTVLDQYKAAYDTCLNVVEVIKKGYTVVLTHGNGPQVGFVLRRSELAAPELHSLPLDTCGADTQGAIGYQIQKGFINAFKKLGVDPIPAVTLITQTLVDREDPSFKNPTKPIGSFMEEHVALEHKEKDGWAVVEDAGRGWRRVVPSPLPQKILEYDAIKSLVDQHYLVICTGGGGIPVAYNDEGGLDGVEAVIDKDLASSLLARQLPADLFVISTAVEQVYINFGKPDQQAISEMTVAEAEMYIAQGHFAPGSMLPKIQAALEYVRETNNKALITTPENLPDAIDGKSGTFITP